MLRALIRRFAFWLVDRTRPSIGFRPGAGRCKIRRAIALEGGALIVPLHYPAAMQVMERAARHAERRAMAGIAAAAADLAANFHRDHPVVLQVSAAVPTIDSCNRYLCETR